jgi:hypothetical protein
VTRKKIEEIISTMSERELFAQSFDGRRRRRRRN